MCDHAHHSTLISWKKRRHRKNIFTSYTKEKKLPSSWGYTSCTIYISISIFLHQSSNYVHLEVLSIDKPRGSMALWYTNLKRNLSEKWKKIKTTQTRKKYIKLTCSNIPRGSMPCSIESWKEMYQIKNRKNKHKTNEKWEKDVKLTCSNKFRTTVLSTTFFFLKKVYSQPWLLY